jgi:hypothetical protein
MTLTQMWGGKEKQRPLARVFHACCKNRGELHKRADDRMAKTSLVSGVIRVVDQRFKLMFALLHTAGKNNMNPNCHMGRASLGRGRV